MFDADRGVYGGIGIHGQALVIHRPADAVIAKVSTHAIALDRDKHELQLAGAVAIGDAWRARAEPAGQPAGQATSASSSESQPSR